MWLIFCFYLFTFLFILKWIKNLKEKCAILVVCNHHWSTHSLKICQSWALIKLFIQNNKKSALPTLIFLKLIYMVFLNTLETLFIHCDYAATDVLKVCLYLLINTTWRGLIVELGNVHIIRFKCLSTFKLLSVFMHTSSKVLIFITWIHQKVNF